MLRRQGDDGLNLQAATTSSISTTIIGLLGPGRFARHVNQRLKGESLEKSTFATAPPQASA